MDRVMKKIILACGVLLSWTIAAAPGTGDPKEEEYTKTMREALRVMRPFIDQDDQTPVEGGQIQVLGEDPLRPNDGRPEENDLLGRPPTGPADAAVRNALDWLTAQQLPNGSWLETESPIAHTGLVTLAYMAYGARHDERGRYRQPLEKGLRWLVDKVGPDGSLKDDGRMYDQAMGTYALAEAYRITKDETLEKPLALAMSYLVKVQDPKGGGWRYKPYQPGDLSVTAWVVGALVTGHVAGIPVEVGVRQKALQFLDSVGGGKQLGLYKYMSEKPPKPTMVAAGLFSYQMLAGPLNNDRVEESVNYIMDHLPNNHGAKDPFYYWYNATLALRLHGTDTDAWLQWRGLMNQALIRTQIKDRSRNHGSWDPIGVHAKREGRIVTTSWTCITLLAPERQSTNTPEPEEPKKPKNPTDRPGLPGQ